MKRMLLVLFFGLMILSCSKQDISLNDANGNTLLPTEWKGKWIILNYWADWCPSCRAEVPEFNHFYQHNQNKNILLYGVNYDQLPLEQLKIAVKNTEINYPVLVTDPTQIWSLGTISVIPMTFIISPKGDVVATIEGPERERSLSKIIASLQEKFKSNA